MIILEVLLSLKLSKIAVGKGRSSAWGILGPVLMDVSAFVLGLLGYVIAYKFTAYTVELETGRIVDQYDERMAAMVGIACAAAGYVLGAFMAWRAVSNLLDRVTNKIMASYVWTGEVMADIVVDAPNPITIGSTGKATFTAPDLGLPENFALLRPGARGYVLTVGHGMGGKVSIDGKEMYVRDFLERGGDGAEGAAGKFRATPVGAGDWGVIDLDKRSDNQVFFRFGKRGKPLPGAGFKDKEALMPALAFAVLMHSIFIGVSYKFKADGNPLVFPGRAGLMTKYMKDRPEPEEPPPEDKGDEPAADKDGDKENIKSATKGESGKAGGEGEKPRARDPNPMKGDPAEAVPDRIKVGFLEDENRESLEKLARRGGFDKDLGRALARLQSRTPVAGSRGGSGTGTGTGFGPGEDGTGTTRGGKRGGAGGGGSAEGDFQSQGKVDTGETRKPKGSGGTGSGLKEKAVVGFKKPSGSFGGLTRAEIDKVVKAKARSIRACYQRALNDNKGLGGKLVVKFRIKPDGKVKSASVSGSLSNKSVQSCVKRQIMKLKFRATDKSAVVNYPFFFSPG